MQSFSLCRITVSVWFELGYRGGGGGGMNCKCCKCINAIPVSWWQRKRRNTSDKYEKIQHKITSRKENNIVPSSEQCGFTVTCQFLLLHVWHNKVYPPKTHTWTSSQECLLTAVVSSKISFTRTCTGFGITGFWWPCPSCDILLSPNPNRIPSAKKKVNHVEK